MGITWVENYHYRINTSVGYRCSSGMALAEALPVGLEVLKHTRNSNMAVTLAGEKRIRTIMGRMVYY